MKIVLTGSLGHIGKPLAQVLVQAGHSVVIISSKADKQAEIEAMGAIAAIGSVENIDFLSTTFTGADAVYCMIPPNFAEPDQIAYYTRVGRSYAQAIRLSGVAHVLDLSSYGAHLPAGTGFITGSYHNEQMLDELQGTAVTHIRPGFFYYNLLNFIPMIKTAGFIGANYGGEDKLALVSPIDIAVAVAEEIVKPAEGIRIRYVVSDDSTCQKVARVLGTAINKPDLQWLTLSNEQMHAGLVANGVPSNAADNLVELGAATHSGILREEYENETHVFGKIKIEDFAKEFAEAYAGGVNSH